MTRLAKSAIRPLGSKRTFTAEELSQVAVPPPFKSRKMKMPSLVPDSSKWECFECGKVINEKKICPFCGFRSLNA